MKLESYRNKEIEEIMETYAGMFIDIGTASFLPKSNPFAFPMYGCISSMMCVFDKYDRKFISTYDFIIFCKKHFLDVDIKDIESSSFRLKDIEKYGDIK